MCINIHSYVELCEFKNVASKQVEMNRYVSWRGVPMSCMGQVAPDPNQTPTRIRFKNVCQLDEFHLEP